MCSRKHRDLAWEAWLDNIQDRYENEGAPPGDCPVHQYQWQAKCWPLAMRSLNQLLHDLDQSSQVYNAAFEMVHGSEHNSSLRVIQSST